MYIFDNEPNAKKLFPKIHQYGEKFKESDEFRAQALKFVQVWNLKSRELKIQKKLRKIETKSRKIQKNPRKKLEKS